MGIFRLSNLIWKTALVACLATPLFAHDPVQEFCPTTATVETVQTPVWRKVVETFPVVENRKRWVQECYQITRNVQRTKWIQEMQTRQVVRQVRPVQVVEYRQPVETRIVRKERTRWALPRLRLEPRRVKVFRYEQQRIQTRAGCPSG